MSILRHAGAEADWDGNTYRAVYTAKLAGVVYVLHVFQKKATKGIATPRHVVALILGRYRRAQEHHAHIMGRRTSAWPGSK